MDTHLQTRQILARNVRILMEMRDWNQHDLQRKAHVSQKTVSNVVNGRQSTQIDVIEKLAAAFKVEPFQLLLPNLFPQDLYPIPPAAA
jgi:transcriptional regulator with XRE-family HTH domain